jgi:hypothetical protein
MTPTPEPTVLFVPAFLFIRLALRTTMAINAVDVITFGLIIARCHSGDLAESFLLLGSKLIIMVMAAIEICACVRP